MVDKAQLARRFGAAARHYDAHARFQQEVGQALLVRMDEGRERGALRERAGSRLGTGFFLPALTPRCETLTGLDPPRHAGPGRLRGSGARLVCGDAERSLADQSLTGSSPAWRCSGASVRPRPLRRAAPGAQTRWSGLSRPCFRGPCGNCGRPGAPSMAAPTSIAS